MAFLASVKGWRVIATFLGAIAFFFCALILGTGQANRQIIAFAGFTGGFAVGCGLLFTGLTGLLGNIAGGNTLSACIAGWRDVLVGRAG